MEIVRADGEKAVADAKCIAKMAELAVRLVQSTRDDHVIIIERENASTRRRIIQLMLGLMFRPPPSRLGHATTWT